MQAHFICVNKRNCRWFLGRNTETGEVTWISEWIVRRPMADIFPLIYKKREDAEESAKKIGGGAYAYSITINK